MSAQEIDEYLDALDEPKRTTLAQLRETILALVPEAEQGISYGVPAFKVRGKVIAGFAAFKNHLSYLPHSGSVFPQLKEELKDYSLSSGALRFALDRPLPAPLVAKLIAVRLRQAFPDLPPPRHSVERNSLALAGSRRLLHYSLGSVRSNRQSRRSEAPKSSSVATPRPTQRA